MPRILASVFDKNGKEACRVWLNGASEKEEPLCGIEACSTPLGWAYPYCASHLKQIFGVAVRESKVHGMGLFATRDFDSGERVVPLGGELIKTQKQLNARYSADDSSDCTASYAIHVKGQGYVDALRLRHAWVFANWSQSPNCMLTNDGIRTRRKVKAGKELFVDYGEEFDSFTCAGEVSYWILP
jgi:hypothetical protein